MINNFKELFLLCCCVLLSVLGAVIYVGDKKNRAKLFYCLMCQFASIAGILEIVYGYKLHQSFVKEIIDLFLILNFLSNNLMAMYHCKIKSNKKLYKLGRLLNATGLFIGVLIVISSINIVGEFLSNYMPIDIGKSRGYIISALQYIYFILNIIYQYFIGRDVSDKAENQRQLMTYMMYLRTMLILFVASFAIALSIVVENRDYFPVINIVLLILILALRIFFLDKKYSFFNKSPRKFIKDIINNMQDGIFLYDENFDIVYSNEAFSEMLDFKKEDVLGKNTMDFFAGKEDDNLFLLDSYYDERQIIYDNKSRKNLSVIFSVMSYRENDGTFIGGVVTIQDASLIVSEREEAIRRKESLNQAIRLAVSRKKEIEEKIELEGKKREKLNEKINIISTKDALTGLENRKSISDRLQAHIDDLEVESIGIIVFDVDDFKSINDSRGHTFGDKLLVELANNIKRLENDKITSARLEEDEFLLLYRDFESLDEVIDLCDKIKEISEKSILVEGIGVNISVSIGVSLYPEHGDSKDSLMKNADSAMYFSKNEGKARFTFYNKALREKSERDYLIMNELDYSLERNEMIINFNPRVQFKDNEKILTSMEASLVWNNKRYGKMLQQSFLDIAVRNGFISKLEVFIFSKVEQFLSEAKERGIDCPDISVRLSEKTFFKEDIIDNVYNIFKGDKSLISKLKLEISEATIMKDIEESIRTLKRLKEYGFKIILTDFGLEHSSLNYLKDIDFDGVKIVEDFVIEIGRSVKDEAIIKTIITLGRLLNIETIAEAVESELRLNFLKENGLTSFQGLLIHPPVSQDRIWDFLEANTIAKDKR